MSYFVYDDRQTLSLWALLYHFHQLHTLICTQACVSKATAICASMSTTIAITQKFSTHDTMSAESSACMSSGAEMLTLAASLDPKIFVTEMMCNPM